MENGAATAEKRLRRFLTVERRRFSERVFSTNELGVFTKGREGNEDRRKEALTTDFPFFRRSRGDTVHLFRKNAFFWNKFLVHAARGLLLLQRWNLATKNAGKCAH
jgi:hypothetical protein